jgi:hypothetical protein
MTKTLFALALASTLMIPQVTPAFGNEGTVGFGGVRPAAAGQQSSKDLRLPALPNLETIPWLTRGLPAANSKVDMLWEPYGDTLRPFLLQPEFPPTKFSLSRPRAGIFGFSELQ